MEDNSEVSVKKVIKMKKSTQPQSQSQDITVLKEENDSVDENIVITHKPSTTITTKLNKSSNPSDITKMFLDEVSKIKEKYNTLRVNYLEMRTAFTEFKDELSAFEKLAIRTMKCLNKNRRRRTNTTNTPSGFHKPRPISSELATFLNKPNDTQMARTDVTKALSEYIKRNNLQNPEDKRIIKPDQPLASLLRVNENEPLTYFNLQSHLSHLFIPQK